MQQTERIDDLEEAIRLALRGNQSGIWSALPCIIQSFDATKCTCTAQPAIQAKVRQKDGTAKWVNMPLLVDVPVQLPGAGNFVVSFPVTQGDECLVVFSSRCIDSWWYTGQIGIQAELRVHDLSDGFALLQCFSVPNVPSGISTTNMQLRTKDGTAHIEMTPAGAVNILAPAGVHITGDLTVSGTTTGTGDGQFNGIHVSMHHHGGVTPGGGSTGEPIDG